MVEKVNFFIFQRQLYIFSNQKRNVIVFYFEWHQVSRLFAGSLLNLSQFLVQFAFCKVQVTHQYDDFQLNFVQLFFLLRTLVVNLVFILHFHQHVLPKRQHVHLLFVDLHGFLNVAILVQNQNETFLLVVLVLKSCKPAVVVSAQFLNQSQVFVEEFETDFLLPKLLLMVFENFQNGGLFIIEDCG